MALRNRAAFANIGNQENTKNVKSAANAVPGQTRRAALGEIGNRVNTVRGTSNLLPKAQKKPVVKQEPSIKSDKPVEKPPVQVVKAVQKKEIAQPIEVKQLEQKLTLHDEPKIKIDAFSADLLHIEDIDEADKGNPILVTAYSNDIYKYLMELERDFPIQSGYLAGQEVTPKMRSVLIDWLVEVHQQFHLLQETLYLTVAVIDRFLQSFKSINRRRLQLVGVAAMFISCKYEEMFAPDIGDFVYITDNAYTKTEILQMELLIVKTLDYSFGRPLPLHFLRRYSKAGRALPVHHTMAKYFLEQSLVHYEMCHYPPSLIAAAAIYLAFFVIGNDDESGKVIWSNTLAYHSTYKKEDLLPVVRAIATIIVNADKSKYQAVRKKYVSNKHMKISLRPELKSPSLQLLANSQ
ncbi:G2/mitotic-specific cyclin-B [Diachasma alloeum]|uniref:Cyclin B n=1 Tax=Diachasma alloeum TaxID=454923 RepID=A0A4E0RQ08_9HYME|nr:G2/mitotic-specific cyclin-B [Diachasma alloeum]THK32844.1 Cyclin B [Diachasma alloeum]